MLKLGYKLMAEEHGPKTLVENARLAEKAGFDFAAISDDFSPWLEEQGHAPLAFAVLGAAAQATRRLGLMTAVTCPIMRYHPAIVAQAAATLGLLSDDRFVLGLGSGERLNEHVVGEGWPGVGERLERLSEALDIIRGLLDGSLRNYRGRYFKLDDARLYDRPDKTPLMIVAAGGPEAARLAGRKADGVITTAPSREVANGYAAGGGTGPRYAEVALCCAAKESEALDIVERYHRWSAAGWAVQAELPNTEGFAAASRDVPREVLAKKVPHGPSPEPHLKAIQEHIDAGYDHIILTQIGPKQDVFLDLFERKLAPALRERAPA